MPKGIEPISPFGLSQEDAIIEFKKFRQSIKREARIEAKPDACRLCGKHLTSFCNSHTLPKLSLKQIAVNGIVLTAYGLTNPLLEREIGVNKTATFHTICRDCDNQFFADYENPDAYIDRPSQKMLGQIATKTYLYAQDKVANELATYHIGSNRFNYDDPHESVRGIDRLENEDYLKQAIQCAKRGNALYSLMLFERLDYVVPVAFHGKLDIISDFEGNVINNLHAQNPSYRIEPLHICVFPLKDASAVIAFHGAKAKRFKGLSRQLSSLNRDDRLCAILKLMLAYSEEVYFSPAINSEALESDAMKKIMAMNIDENAYIFATGARRQTLIQVAANRYAIQILPDIPNLLAPMYALH